MTNPCPSREEYQDLLNGLLSDAEEQYLEAHVKSCAGCLAILEELTAVSSLAVSPLALGVGGLHASLHSATGPAEAPTKDALDAYGPTKKAKGAEEILERLQQGARPDADQLTWPSLLRGAPWRGGKPKAAVNEDNLPRFEGYKLLGVLGSGGMGVVCKAEQLGLGRIVALKMIRGGIVAENRLSRFRIEVMAVARLQHPNIVQIFEVGGSEQQPYYSLEYVDGGSLADKLAGLPQPPRSASQLVELVARAVHYAHERGIVHRDLKPGNILLTAEGAPKIADFGLAKLLEGETGAATNTASSAALIQGTPCYMAPEQADPAALGTGIGRAADVYALGVILYEMLTGQPPFQSESPLETVLQVLHAEPTPPRRFRPELPRDLETICLKCLAKHPARRYASALDLAEDLRRFRAGEPIRARPVSRSERLWRWSRRNPTVAALLTSLAVVLIGGLGLVTWKWRAEVRAVDVARQEKRQADEARREAHRWAARGFVDQAINQGDHGNIDRALLLLARGLELAVTGGDRDLDRAIRLNLALWRRPLIRRRAQFPHGDWVWAVAYSPDGKLCATASKDKTARLWDVFSGEPVGKPLEHNRAVWAVAFSPDGKKLLTGSGDDQNGEGAVRLWEVPTGKPLGQPFALELGGKFVSKLSLGPDGKTVLVVGFGEAHLCTIRPVKPAPVKPAPVKPADDEPRGERACLPLPHPNGVFTAVLSPDGGMVLTGGVDGTARLWDAATAKPIGPALDHNPPGGLPDNQNCRVTAVAFSPDGQLVLTGTQVVDTVEKRFVSGEVRLWHVRDSTQVGEAWPHVGPIKTIVFSPDGRRALSSALLVDEPAGQRPEGQPNLRGAVQLWDVTTAKPIGPVMKQSKPVWAAAFSPDGKIVLTGSEGGKVQFWLTATGLPLGTPVSNLGNVNSVVFSPDGRTALTSRTYENAAATLWEVPYGPGDVVPTIFVPGVQAMVFAPDGAKLVTANGESTAQVWDVAGARATGPALVHGGRIHAVALSPDGKTVATGGSDQAVRLWNAVKRTQLKPPLLFGFPVLAAAFSPDAKLLLTCTNDGTSQIREMARGTAVGQPCKLVGWPRAAAFHPNGKTFVIPTGEGKVGQWDTATGKPSGATFHHQRPVTALAFSPDGTTLATGSRDQTAALWDAGTGRALCSPLQHDGQVRTVAFNSDGTKLLTGSDDGAARLWDVATGVRLGPLFVHSSPVLAAFRPKNDLIATLAEDGPLRLWDIPPAVAGEVQEIKEWVSALTGKDLTDNGILRELDRSSLRRLRRKR